MREFIKEQKFCVPNKGFEINNFYISNEKLSSAIFISVPVGLLKISWKYERI